MDGGVAGGCADCAPLMTVSFHDLEQTSAVVVPRLHGSGGTPTDRNGNNLSSFVYADIKGR